MRHIFIANEPPKDTTSEKIIYIFCYISVLSYVGFFSYMDLWGRIILGCVASIPFIFLFFNSRKKNYFTQSADITIFLPSRHFVMGESFDIDVTKNDKGNLMKNIQISLCVKEEMYHYVSDQKIEYMRGHTFYQQIIFQTNKVLNLNKKHLTVHIPTDVYPTVTFLEDNMYPSLPGSKEGYSLNIVWALRVEAKSRYGLFVKQDFTIAVAKDQKHLALIRDKQLYDEIEAPRGHAF